MSATQSLLEIAIANLSSKELDDLIEKASQMVIDSEKRTTALANQAHLLVTARIKRSIRPVNLEAFHLPTKTDEVITDPKTKPIELISHILRRGDSYTVPDTFLMPRITQIKANSVKDENKQSVLNTLAISPIPDWVFDEEDEELIEHFVSVPLSFQVEPYTRQPLKFKMSCFEHETKFMPFIDVRCPLTFTPAAGLYNPKHYAPHTPLRAPTREDLWQYHRALLYLSMHSNTLD